VARTFRHRGHFEGEAVTYWDKEELGKWKAHDPVALLGERLKREAGFEEGQLKGLRTEVDERINEAVAFARRSPPPAPRDALEDLFA